MELTRATRRLPAATAVRPGPRLSRRRARCARPRCAAGGRVARGPRVAAARGCRSWRAEMVTIRSDYGDDTEPAGRTVTRLRCGAPCAGARAVLCSPRDG